MFEDLECLLKEDNHPKWASELASVKVMLMERLNQKVDKDWWQGLVGCRRSDQLCIREFFDLGHEQQTKM